MIRDACAADAPHIAALWNPLIRDTTVTFTSRLKTPQDLAEMLATKAAAGQPFLVAQGADMLLGFATYGAFRDGPGYAHTVEHTVILAEAARGQGLGRRLMAELETRAQAAKIHSMIAGISASNTSARAFHRAIGFAQVAELPEVGFKFGKWHNLILMQKQLYRA